MRLGFVSFSLSLIAANVLSASGVAAHGASHAAVAVLAWDERGVSMVRLTHGLAYRDGDGFRFVCPEAWGGEVAVPSSAIPDGPAVVAAEQLFLIESDGSVSPHPSHRGAGIALTRNRDALFGLFRRDGRVELRRITPDASELVRAFGEPFSALAASDDTLSLLRASGQELTLQQLSLDGELRERLTWGEPSKIASAELRASDDALYVTLVHSAAPWLTLGRVNRESYEQLRSANSAFAGPVVFAGEVLVARDGTLELLDGSRAFSPGTYIECLDAFADRAYACVGDGLTAVDQDGLAEPLFDMGTLREPDYGSLSAAQRADCSARWRDVRDHLLLEGRIQAAPTHERENSDADGGVGETDAVAAPSTCSLHGTSRSAGWLSALLLALLFSRCARRYSASEL